MVMQFLRIQIQAGNQRSSVAKPNQQIQAWGPCPRTVSVILAPRLEQESNFSVPEVTRAELGLNVCGARHKLIQNCKIVRSPLSRHQNLVLIVPKLVSIIEIE